MRSCLHGSSGGQAPASELQAECSRKEGELEGFWRWVGCAGSHRARAEPSESPPGTGVGAGPRGLCLDLGRGSPSTTRLPEEEWLQP